MTLGGRSQPGARSTSVHWSRSACLLLLLTVGCDSAPPTNPEDLGPGDAGIPADAGDLGPLDRGLEDTGADAGDAKDTGETVDLGDLATPDLAALDLGSLDQGQDAGASPDAGPPAGEVNLSFTGCQPQFSGDIIVSANGSSLSVGSLQGGLLQASLQFSLGSNRGLMNLSSQHRIATGVVVNLVAPDTWSNLAQDPRAISGEIPDPISGVLNVRMYDRAAGIAEIDFMQVTLQNVVDEGLCTLDGSLSTSRLGR